MDQEVILHYLWHAQYVGLFTIWGVLLAQSVYILSSRVRFDRFAFCTLWAGIWYVGIQTHWVWHMADKIPGWTEIMWTTFEAYIGLLLIQALTRRSV